MAEQATLFSSPSLAAVAIQRAIDRGQRITPWARMAVESWVARGVKIPSKGVPEWERKLYADVDTLPMPCDCAHCGETAVIFPPEDGAPKGYCICPKCSAPKIASVGGRADG